jgi:hypothetical protein
MFKRKALVISIASVAALTLVGLASAQKVAKLKDRRLVTKNELLQHKQERAKEDATPVVEGVMTPQQREHSKLYKDHRTGKKLRDLTATVGDVSLRRDVGVQGGDVGEPSFDLQRLLQEMAGNADAVVVGTVTNKSSQLTEDEDYVFTDYEMSVGEVLKDNPAAPIRTNNRITVTRPGGTILLNGRVVEAIDEAFQPLRKKGQYLVFLRFIPSTGGYQALNSKASFQIDDDEVGKLTKEPLSIGDAKVSAFMNEVRAAVAAASKTKGGAE